MENQLGTLLVEMGLISNQMLEQALAIQREGDEAREIPPGEYLGKILLRLRRLSARELVLVLCEQHGKLDYVLLDGFPVDPVLASQVGQAFSMRYRILPLVPFYNDLTLFLSNRPLPLEARRELTALLNTRVDDLPAPEVPLPTLIGECFALMESRESTNVRLGEILVRKRLLSSTQLEKALQTAADKGLPLGQYLIRHSIVEEIEVYRILASQYKMKFLSSSELLELGIDYDLAPKVKPQYSRFNRIIPVKVEKRSLLAVTDIPAMHPPSELAAMFDCDSLVCLLVSTTNLAQVFIRSYDEHLDPTEAEAAGKERGRLMVDAEEERAPDVEMSESSAGHERTLQSLLASAISLRASDIHIDSYAEHVQVRFRIDGVLHRMASLEPARDRLAALINIIKIEAGMDITETRLPQGGSFRKRDQDGRIYDFRIQMVPTVHDESAVIRILPAKQNIIEMDRLGLQEPLLERYKQVISNPNGLVLVTGPAGTGKTTTLCSTLVRLAGSVTRKVLTVEDPVEYVIPNVLQSEIIPAKNIGFAEMARAFVRMDPDVILIGEIRDHETAFEALRLSYSGHLIFATLHTSTTITAYYRMCGFQVEPAFLLDQLVAVLSQRLVRRLCPFCRTGYEPDGDTLGSCLPGGVPEGMRFYQSPGCGRCDMLGHRGRELLAELLVFDEKTRDLFRNETDSMRIYKQLKGISLMSMLDDAMLKVHRGLVDLRSIPEAITQDYLQAGPSKKPGIPG